MTAMSYRAGADELSKIALKFNMPKLKSVQTKFKQQVVKSKSTVKPKMVTPAATQKMGVTPEFSVGRAGEVGSMVQPPAVKI